jgi:uncharacterized protein YutE (UPF0331/DUF86 family)
MTPQALDRSVLTRRLHLLDETLTQLRALRDTDADVLRREPLTRAALERLVQVTVDLAVDINAHLVVGLGCPAPATARSSFAAVADAGVLDAKLAEELAPATGLRNLLVHRYADIDLDLLVAGMRRLLERCPDYITAVARFVQQLPSSEAHDSAG